MKYLFTAMLTALCGIGSVSAAVVTSTSCSAGTQSTSNPTNCSINSPHNIIPNTIPSAAANININQLTSVPSQGSFTNFALDVAGSATATPGILNDPGATINSSASATANITYLLSTPGPVRQGVVTISSNVSNLQSGPGDDSAAITVSIGSLGDSCSGGMGCQSILQFPTRSFAFTLGNTFAFNLSEAFKAAGNFDEGTGFARGGLNLNFQLFEADGKTPVAVSAAPEPGTLGLLLTCFGGVGATCIMRRARRSS